MLEADVYGAYHPKSRETKAAYRDLLLHVQARLGDQPPEVLYGAAEEVLAVLKDDTKKVCSSRCTRAGLTDRPVPRNTSLEAFARGVDCGNAYGACEARAPRGSCAAQSEHGATPRRLTRSHPA